MQIRAAGLFDVTGIALVRRVASANVCNVSYEEHTPEPWNAALLASSMPQGSAQAQRIPQMRARQRPMHTQMPHTEVRPSGAVMARTAGLGRVANATMGRVADATRTRLPPPPPPPMTQSQIQLGEPLLPERSHDPKYYPGLVEDPPVEWGAGKAWKRWAVYGGGALAVFIAGLLVARGGESEPTSWNAVVDTTPADANVTIDGEPLSGGNPRTRPGLMRGDHVLSVTAPGYETHRQVFTLNGSDQRIVVTLERETPKPDPSLEESQPMAAASTSLDERLLSPKELAKKRRSEARAERARERYRERKGSSSADSGDDAAPARSSGSSSAGSGLLKLNSIPWSEVYVDKKRVGNTPLLGLTLPAGKHTIRLSNPQLGLEKTLHIKLKAGETITKVEKLGG